MLRAIDKFIFVQTLNNIAKKPLEKTTSCKSCYRTNSPYNTRFTREVLLLQTDPSSRSSLANHKPSDPDSYQEIGIILIAVHGNYNAGSA